MADECPSDAKFDPQQGKHTWLTNSGRGGDPEFRINRQMSPEPLMHVVCTRCGARTWFTEKDWHGGKEFWSLR